MTIRSSSIQAEMRQSLLMAILGLVAAVVSCTDLAVAEERLEYNRDIRPLLADNCFSCHGPDSAAREADLRLDQRDDAIDMGSIVPHDPDDSELIRRIRSTDPDEVMPPPETEKKMSEAEIRLLSRWIEEGAEYQLHWSFIAPKRPSIPKFDRGPGSDWPRNPIDRFVLARLRENSLTPAPEADRYTLARRVSLDLTGLPPDPELVAAFVDDPSSGTYERLVDQLLDSEHWGEHRGRYWLDYSRYADTHGIHFDNYREMWSYRDWVIQAFNANMTYDQFTIENLAGDLLPNASLDQRIGSGFNRCNMTTNEGGIIDEEYLVLYTRDRTETTSQIWLGLTAGCGVCHSHKFDPLSQREFYEMAAFFNNTTQAARDGNIKDTPPIVTVPRVQDRSRWELLPKLISQVRGQLDARRAAALGEFDSFLSTASASSFESIVPHDDLHVHAPLDEGNGAVTRILVEEQLRPLELADSTDWREEGNEIALQLQGAACDIPEAGDFEVGQPFTCSAWINLPANDGYGAICARMDNDNQYRGWDFWMQQRQVGMHLINAWPENGIKVVAKTQVPANQWVHVTVTYDGSETAAGVKVYYDGKPQATNVESDRLSGSIRSDVAFRLGQRSRGEPFTGGLRDLRVYRRALSTSEVTSLAQSGRFVKLLSKPAKQRTDEEATELFDFWLRTFDTAFGTLSNRLAELDKEQKTLQSRGTIAHVMHERDEMPSAYILFRGEYDKRQDQVSPDTPDILPPFPKDYPRNRLGFAKWLLLPEHPLTARVTVNRFWQEVFGTGIVETTGDFGIMGQLPSHPELLDWLAIEFRESGWDVKHLFKLIVTSATYRQSAVTTAEKLEVDPKNRLFSRGPRFRMDAEMVRDYALAASGLLRPEIGGPSVKPYQPPGVWAAIAMNVSNTRKYEVGTGDDLYRRSLYTFIKRMAPPASMDIFNAPNREYCVVRRERTNTPLQALVTLNDEQFVEAARHLAQVSILEGGSTFEGRLRVLGSRLLIRPFRAQEVSVIRASLDELLKFYKEHPDQAKQVVSVGVSEAIESVDTSTLAAWTMLANQLMNLDEVLNK